MSRIREESFITLNMLFFSFVVPILSIWSVIILKLCESGYSVAISILAMAQGLVLNIRRDEIFLKIFLDKTEGGSISFLSSHNLC